MSTEKTMTPTPEKPKRNYQLDALKLLLAVFVFLNHSRPLIGENTRFFSNGYVNCLGAISVQIFFVISGFLMVHSASKKTFDPTNAGKTALQMTVSKFKQFAGQYWAALLIAVVIYVYVTKTNPAFTGKDILWIILNEIPEIFAVNLASGDPIRLNIPCWYISAMLLVLPVFYYLYIRFKDFFLYIFSPLAALFTWGYFCNRNALPVFEWNGICMDVIPRAICGLSFGVVGYLIYERIAKMPKTKQRRIIFTISEIVLYGIFFFSWVVLQAPMKTLLAMLPLVPFMIAITFSQMSYISELFRFKWMRFLAPLSLAIFFNHYSTMLIVKKFHWPISYKEGVLLMALYTVGFCILNWLIVRACKTIYKKVKNKNDTEIRIQEN